MFYREYSVVKHRIEKFLDKNHRFKVIKRMNDPFARKTTYVLAHRWSIFTMRKMDKQYQLTLAQMDDTVTGVELRVLKNGVQYAGQDSTVMAYQFLARLAYFF